MRGVRQAQADPPARSETKKLKPGRGTINQAVELLPTRLCTEKIDRSPIGVTRHRCIEQVAYEAGLQVDGRTARDRSLIARHDTPLPSVNGRPRPRWLAKPHHAFDTL